MSSPAPGAPAGGAGPPPIILTGPTGAGKSGWALRLAEVLPVEIVSVDSAQVYRGLDIGTAKPDAATRARVPHHLVDIRDPAEAYSAGEFVADAERLIAEVQARGHIPLLVGGTMLYLRALLGGIAELPRASPEVRAALDARAAQEGWPVLHAELARVDPAAAARIHPNDPQRIQRALEVHAATGRPISELQASLAPPRREIVRWALVPADRARLHAAIARRFEDMMRAGLLDEVAQLRARGDLSARSPSMRAVGYRQLWEHLEGLTGRQEAVERAVAATRQLAKRQLTWLRSDPGVTWLDPDTPGAWAAWNQAVRALSDKFGR